MAEAVLLIPGFFGFGHFGTKPGASIEYFAGVRRELERALPSLKERILVHEPSPTGSIDERAAGLHDAVRAIVEGKALPHNPALRASRIHLVGHSAGGVDARLYANAGFSWQGGPRDEERRAALAAIGHVVTLSSPLSGTPIATNALFDRDTLLFGVYLASILGMGKIRLSAATLYALSIVGKRAPRGNLFGSLLRFLSDLDDQSATELQGFLSALVDDRQLMHGLQVSSMTARTAQLRVTEHPNLHCYVSVAPPPRWSRVAPIEGLIYRLAYDATARGCVPGGALPQGPIIGGRIIERLRDADPNDGVVPVASQTLDGHAAAIVEGDHLDVVGHFAGGSGLTVFKSNAGFDETRMRALWAHVASTLGKRAQTKPLAVAG